MSLDNADLLLWGTRDNSSVKLLGLTLTVGVRDMEVIKSRLNELYERLNNVLEVASLLSRRCHSVFFVILYSLSGGSPFRVTDPSDAKNLSKSFEVQETKMPQLVEEFYGTSLGNRGTAKAVNKSTADWFHDWARANLPREYVRTNIDGLLLGKSQKPKILLETKRSFYEPYSWSPFHEDSRNYYLQHLLATKSDLHFWTVYHKKGERIDNASQVALFVIEGVSLKTERDWISLHRFNTNAGEVLNMIDERCSEDP
jgi:hypothetical protein